MSIATLTNPENESNIFCFSLAAENIICQNLTAVVISFFNLTTDTVTTKHIVYSQSPPIDNSAIDFIVYDSLDGELKINNGLINQDVRAGSNPSFTSVDIHSTGTTHITLYCTTTTPYFDFNGGSGLITIPTTTTTLVGDNTTDSLSNKTIDSASNTISVNSTNINSLIDQDVRTTASPSFVGVQLQTSGGTPSLLDFYETYTTACTLSGVWASSQNTTMRLTRVGTMVSCSFDAVFATATIAAAAITCSAPIPLRFRPVNGNGLIPYILMDNSVNAMGLMLISLFTGDFTFILLSGANFTAANDAGVWSSGASWVVS